MINLLRSPKDLSLGLCALGTFIALPLVWVRLFGTTIAPYHVMGGVVSTLLFFLTGFREAAFRIFGTARLVWIGSILMVVGLIGDVTGANPLFEPYYLFKYVAFVMTAFTFAILMLTIVQRNLFRYVALLPALSAVVFIVLISIQFSIAGIAPVELLQQAIAKGDPGIVIFQMLRPAFIAGNEDLQLRSNLKQSLGLAFLVMVPIGFMALSYAKDIGRVWRSIAWGGITFAVVMAIMSFSRATWLAMFLMAICYASITVRTARGLMVLMAALVILVPATLYILQSSSLFILLEARLSESDSYMARIDATALHWEAIGRSPIFGRGYQLPDFAHNVVIDAWSALGIIGLFGAGATLAGMIVLIVKALLSMLQAPLHHRIVYVTVAALACPAVSRMFTAPNLIIDFAAWLGLAMSIGIAADVWATSRKAAGTPGSAGIPTRPAFAR